MITGTTGRVCIRSSTRSMVASISTRSSSRHFCHYVFPTFDQPDLKASLSLKTIVPGDWEVVANEHPKGTEQNDQLLSEMQAVAEEFK